MNEAWERGIVERVKAKFAEVGIAANMSVLHMKDGTEEKRGIMSPTSDMETTAMSRIKEEVLQRMELIEETATILNVRSDGEHRLAIVFESRKTLKLREFVIQEDKTLREVHYDAHVRFSLGLFHEVPDYGVMYG